MGKRNFRYFVGDFETTVFEGQEWTEVWASAIVELFHDEVHIFHSIGDTLEWLLKADDNICIYYHNLKFDGSFYIDYLLKHGFKQAFVDDGENRGHWLPVKEMPNRSFSYSISLMGQWYRITIKNGKRVIEIRDSLKLLPFSVKDLGRSFETTHKKLEMEYTGFRYAGCPITTEEEAYIKNDVLVVKEALEIMFTEGHNKITIGSCCLSEFKSGFDRHDYQWLFPNLYEIELYDGMNAGDWIRKTYRGGWCYLVPEKSCKKLEYGVTADVNSLYPSMMHSISGNVFPFGCPHYFRAPEIPEAAIGQDRYFFVHIRTKFELKSGKLPFVQIKNNLFYVGNEMLTTSRIRSHIDGKLYDYWIDENGSKVPAVCEIYMTQTDYYLFLEHYNVHDFEIIDGCWFWATDGLFDDYIEKYKKIKMESKGAKRTLAKLYLNNLYGKMASNTDSSFKFAYLKDDGSVGYKAILANDKTPGYIAIGSAITSYARNFTIRHAQANYHGPDAPGFVYADTDSIHCDFSVDELEKIEIDDNDFCKWKIESEWDVGWFVRQKTYIEHVISENLKPVDPFYEVKCAGMPKVSKDLFISSMTGEFDEDGKDIATMDFLKTKRSLEDFNVGLEVPGKLLPHTIPGGVVLEETTFTMK